MEFTRQQLYDLLNRPGPLWLSRADLSDAYLDGVMLAQANLSRAILQGASLAAADLTQANLLSANLSKIIAPWASFYGANLQGANLHQADLAEANLENANLFEANLYEANLEGANLAGADLQIGKNAKREDYKRSTCTSGIYRGGDSAGWFQRLILRQLILLITEQVDSILLLLAPDRHTCGRDSWEHPHTYG